MSVQAVVMDWRPAYLQGAQSSISMLLAPLGTQSVLHHMWSQLAGLDLQSLTIMPDFDADVEYRRMVQGYAGEVQFRRDRELLELVESCEAADLLLVIDPRCYPLEGYEFGRLLHGPSTCHLPRHLVHLQQDRQGARERVLYDSELRVHCVQRLFEGVTQVEGVGVSASVVSAAVARRLDYAARLSPGQIRRQLTARDIPNTDLPVRGPAFDLSSEAGLLGLNERLVLGGRGGVGGRRREDYSIWAGAGSSVDPHCRLYGPVVVQSGARVEADAVVIGPAVLGAGAQVARGALVCQCVLGPGARAGSGECLARRVLTDRAPAQVSNGGPGAEEAWAGARTAVSREKPRRRRLAFAERSAGGRWYPAFKRGIDGLAGLIGLIALAPVLVVTGLLIKLTSRGPVLFGHEREGLHGRVFRCWKFRTMIAGAHSQQRALYVQSTVDGPQFKIPHDPRVTRLGRWLRAANIDELPQLFNVLRGDMSLIGPRPSPFRENQICIPWRNARLSVRPGITGLWQVCRRERDTGDFHQWIYFDVLYVRRLSLWLDLRVLLATFITMGGRWSVPLRLMIPQVEGARRFEMESVGWLDPNVLATARDARVSARPVGRN